MQKSSKASGDAVIQVWNKNHLIKTVAVQGPVLFGRSEPMDFT